VAAHEDFSRTHAEKSSSNRAFGWVFTGAFLVIGLWPLLRHAPLRPWALVVSAVFLCITLAAPALLSIPNRLWQRIGQLMNRIVSPVVLAFLFYVVVTPMGVLMRSTSKSKLKWRRGGDAESYWIPRQPPGPKPDSLGHQF
jgi:hypothetical protein